LRFKCGSQSDPPGADSRQVCNSLTFYVTFIPCSWSEMREKAAFTRADVIASQNVVRCAINSSAFDMISIRTVAMITLFTLEVGRYIKNIVDISPISIYSICIVSALQISFFRYRYRIDDSEILVIFRYFIIFSRLFNVNLKIDNYMITIEYRIRQCDASIVTPVTSLPLY